MLTDDDTPDLTRFPRRVDADGAALLVTQHYFPITAGVVQSWPLVWRSVDGRPVCETADLLSLAQAKIDAAPLLPSGGRGPASELLHTLELWPLEWWAMNGAAVCEAAERLRLALPKQATPQSLNAHRQTADANT
jgi:hypothetical protein